jgi:hypothetical protein
MSTNIYLFKTHRINLLEIAGVQMIKNAPEKFFPICQYELDGKFLSIKQNGRMVDDLISRNCAITDFRKVTWSQYKEYLDQCISTAIKNNQNILFGTQRQDQFDYLSNQYPDIIKTLAVTYKSDSYDFLLKNVAEYHIYLLVNGKLKMNQQDQTMFKFLAEQEIAEFYKNSFDKLGIIPRESPSTADHTIDVLELFNPDYFSRWLKSLGFGFTDQGLEFYKKWAELNQP